MNRWVFEGRNILTIPGWQGSEAAHWQSVWERKYPEFRRIEQSEWLRPRCGDWIHTLGEAIESSENPVVLVAHSLGCIAVACWASAAAGAAEKVDCALLVAPPNLSCRADLPEPLRHFAPVPKSTLRFRSVLIGSENDPYMRIRSAERLAVGWGSEFVNAGAVGHINCASGFGDWPQGEAYLERLLRRERAVDAARPAMTAPAVDSRGHRDRGEKVTSGSIDQERKLHAQSDSDYATSGRHYVCSNRRHAETGSGSREGRAIEGQSTDPRGSR